MARREIEFKMFIHARPSRLRRDLMVRRISVIGDNCESYNQRKQRGEWERKSRVGPMDAVEKHLVF
jgi:hypothetical protein